MPNNYPNYLLLSVAWLISLAAPQPTTACQGATDQPKNAGNQKNVLFIAVDDLKPVLGCYGDEHVHSPNMDRLAKRGTTFLNAHCQQAVCGPSRVSLLTGVRPDTTRVYDLKTRFRDILPDVITIPQHFKASGYQSVGLGKIFDPRSADSHRQMDSSSWSEPYLHPKSVSAKTLGYLDANVVAKIKMLHADGIDGREELLEAIGKPAVDSADVEDEAYDDGMLAKRAVELIEQMSKQDKPFFLAVGFKKPHLPFNAPQQYWDLYDREQLPLASVHQLPIDGPEIAFQDSWELRSYDAPKEGPVPIGQQRELIHGYYACVSYIDTQVGKLLDAVDQAGIADDTVIVLWGDHGWHLGDHGMWCKHTNFEQATRVPLIFVAPDAKKRGGLTNSPVEFIDIFPTLCELAGIEPPVELQGTSLLPSMKDNSVSVKPVAISQYPRRIKKQHVMGYALRDQRYRYIEWRHCGGARSPGKGPVVARELYDYKTDPLETKNWVDDPAYREVVKKMEELFQELKVGQDLSEQVADEHS